MSGPGDPTRQEWHRVAELAQADLQANPNDPDAQAALAAALDGIRAWADSQGERGSDTQRGLRRDVEAGQPGPALAFASEAARAASFGLPDEIRGVGTSLLGGIRGRNMRQEYLRGRDEYRAVQDAARAHNPRAAVSGMIAGTLANPVNALFKGAVGGASIIPDAAIGTRAAAAARGGLIGAAEGAARGYGEGENGPVADLADVPVNAALGFVTGTAGTAFANRSLRRETARIRAARKVMDEEDKAALDLSVARQTAGPRVVSATGAAERQPGMLQLQNARVAETGTRAELEAARLKALEQSIGDFPERQAARRVAEAQRAAGAERAAERHALQTNRGATGPETPDAVRLRRLARERADRAEATRQRLTSGGTEGRKPYTEYVNRPPDRPSGVAPPRSATVTAPPETPVVSRTRGRTVAQMAPTSTPEVMNQMASTIQRMVSRPPTPETQAQVMAQFVNIPAASRLAAVQQMIGQAPTEASWAPIFERILAMP